MAGHARQQPVELILLRQFAARLNTPTALFDREGRLIYLNPAAERAFGVEFASIGELSLEQILAITQPTDVHGAPLTADTLPVGKAIGPGQPELGTISIHDLDGRVHRLGTTTIPVQGLGDVLYGAMSLFWELEDPPARSDRPGFGIGQAAEEGVPARLSWLAGS